MFHFLNGVLECETLVDQTTATNQRICFLQSHNVSNHYLWDCASLQGVMWGSEEIANFQFFEIAAVSLNFFFFPVLTYLNWGNIQPGYKLATITEILSVSPPPALVCCYESQWYECVVATNIKHSYRLTNFPTSSADVQSWETTVQWRVAKSLAENAQMELRRLQ